MRRQQKKRKDNDQADLAVHHTQELEQKKNEINAEVVAAHEYFMLLEELRLSTHEHAAVSHWQYWRRTPETTCKMLNNLQSEIAGGDKALSYDEKESFDRQGSKRINEDLNRAIVRVEIKLKDSENSTLLLFSLPTNCIRQKADEFVQSSLLRIENELDRSSNPRQRVDDLMKRRVRYEQAYKLQLGFSSNNGLAILQNSGQIISKLNGFVTGLINGGLLYGNFTRAEQGYGDRPCRKDDLSLTACGSGDTFVDEWLVRLSIIHVITATVKFILYITQDLRLEWNLNSSRYIGKSAINEIRATEDESSDDDESSDEDEEKYKGKDLKYRLEAKVQRLLLRAKRLFKVCANIIFLFNVTFVAMSWAAWYRTPFMYSFHMLEVFFIFETGQELMRIITMQLKQLLLTLLLGMVATYCFAVVGWKMVRQRFNYGFGEQEVCPRIHAACVQDARQSSPCMPRPAHDACHALNTCPEK